MQTVYEAAGGADGLLGLVNAWHARVMADEVVSHAFSYGFHPEHSQRLPPIGESRWVARRPIQTAMETRPSWCGCIAATVCTRRWTDKRSPASIMHWQISISPTIDWHRCCTTTLRGRPLRRSPDITGPQMMSRTDYAFRDGRGRGSSVGEVHNPDAISPQMSSRYRSASRSPWSHSSAEGSDPLVLAR